MDIVQKNLNEPQKIKGDVKGVLKRWLVGEGFRTKNNSFNLNDIKSETVKKVKKL